jgi:NitT/TauT family transport system ATP-binding protein
MTVSPGRQKALIEIDLPRPRIRAELLLNRRYQEYLIDIERLMFDAHTE